MKIFRIFILLAIIIFCQISAYAVPNDLESWDAIVLEVPMNKKFNFYIDVQPRIGDDLTQLNTLVVRPAIHYKINENVMIGQGFSWQPHVTPVFNNENRPYQEIIYRKKYEKVNLTLRARTEERLIEGTSGASIRQRFLVRLKFPMSKEKEWGYIAANELLINLNSLAVGPKGGLDQERVYFGVYKKLNKDTSLELAYIFNPVWGGTSGGASNEYLIRHIIALTLNINLDNEHGHYTPSVPY